MWNPFAKRTTQATVADSVARIVGSNNLADQTLEMAHLVRRVDDGFVNAAAGLGTARDKRYFSRFDPIIPMGRQELENMWDTNWLSKRIVSVPVEDALAEWIKVQWDFTETKGAALKTQERNRQQQVYEWEKRFDVRAKWQESNEWGRLYGGCLLVIGIKGEKDLSKPLDIKRLGKGCLSYLHVIDRWRVGATDLMDLPDDLDSPNFGRPRFYNMASQALGPGGLVHWSRVIPFHGERLPWFAWLANGMWHRSTLQSVVDDVKDYSNVMSLLATMFFEANVDVMAIAGLAKLLSMPNGKQKVMDRFEMAATLKSANRMLIIDKEDSYEKKANSMQGLAAAVGTFVTNVSGAANTPTTRLFGEQAAGLGSEGKGDQKNYNKFLRAIQKRNTPGMEYLYTIAAIDMFGTVPPGWNLSWNPLEQETGLERAQRENQNAQRDKTYSDIGAITPLTIAKQLHEDKVYSAQDQDDVDEVEEAMKAGDPEESAKLITMGQETPEPVPVPVKAPPTKGGKPGSSKPSEEDEDSEDVPLPKAKEVGKGGASKRRKTDPAASKGEAAGED
jgi:uncharacterized protein